MDINSPEFQAIKKRIMFKATIFALIIVSATIIIAFLIMALSQIKIF